MSKFKVDVSLKYQRKMIESKKDEKIHNETLLHALTNKEKKNRVPWDFRVMRDLIKKKIPIGIYAWYHEETSSAGNSTYHSIEAFNKYRLKPHYLEIDKNFDAKKTITLHSSDLGTSFFSIDCPFFTVPYGCASVYGGKSDEMNVLKGTIEGGGIYTIPALSKYSLEEYGKKLKDQTFFMYQLYLTSDNDINISLIERAKSIGVSVILLTIDNPVTHQAYDLIENGADMTFQKYFSGNVLVDPVFNIKCYKNCHCVGTRDFKILGQISPILKISSSKLYESYDEIKSFEYARDLQLEGMSMANFYEKKNNPQYHYSIIHIKNICHSKKSVCPYDLYSIHRAVPLVIKGCMNKEGAVRIMNSGVDGLYVTIHGGRYLYDAEAPINVLQEISDSVKAKNKNFGVWFDGGIRNGFNIMKAYARGADFVGIGRPIIYACVLYGSIGVYSIYQQYLYELKKACQLCGINNMNDRLKLKDVLYSDPSFIANK